MARNRKRLFEILVREHELALLAFVRSCVYDRGAAEDLVQETFLVAWNRLDDYDENTPFARWLRGIARNKVLAHYRASATAGRHVRLLAPGEVAAVADEFDRLIPGRGEAVTATVTALRECLTRLKSTDHEVIHQAYHRRQTCRAIAEQLGRTVEAVKKRLQRARAQLRDCILAKLAAESPDG